ncbi:MAG: hypothetical protein ACO1TE_11215 [Prosthecobacter sp.]
MSDNLKSGQESYEHVGPEGRLQNPFPATAVARLSTPEDEFWSIETDALKQARNQLSSYLNCAIAEPSNGHVARGMVLAIVGDYGTGKTHIAQEMLRQIDAQHDSRLHPLYLDAPSDTFLALYRQRFIQKLSKAEVLRRVDDLYSDIVARELELSPVTAPVAVNLRNRKFLPDDLVKKLGLMESRLVHELGTELRHVTERNDFGTALLLFRRPEFQAAVWEWLSGSPPDAVLRERGIELHINSDAAALEAIGVMAFLFGRQDHHFILFIDELEKVFTQAISRRPDEAAILAFKKLMETVGQTGALLVLVGLPECLDILPEDARQRIASVIRPSAITATEIEKYVIEANRRAFGTNALEPFTKDTLEYVSEIAGGNARRVVRLCYHAYLAASLVGSHTTRAMLREIAREQFELNPAGDVEAEITRCIEAHGWLFERGKILQVNKKNNVDFWLPVGSKNIGIAIFVAPSILHKLDVKAVIDRAQRDLPSTFETVLVINGYLADNLRQSLTDAFTKMIVFRMRDFREDLGAALSGIRIRLQEQSKQTVLDQIHEGVEQISRQNSSFESRLSHLLDTRLTNVELQRAVSTGLRAVFGQLASNTSTAEAQFPSVASLFDRAQQILDEALQLEALYNLVFGLPLSQHRFRSSHFSDRHSKEIWVHFETFIENKALATAQFYIAALSAFRKGVFFFLENSARHSDALKRSSYVVEEIANLCSMFDSVTRRFEIVDLLVELRSNAHRLIRERSVEDLGEFQIWSLDKMVIDRSQTALRDLGHDVWRAVRNELEQQTMKESR